MPKPVTLCFGEILWDSLPHGLFPGGAPFNVAYHLHQHGMEAMVVSAVGGDLLGDELCRRLECWGMKTDGITRNAEKPTGLVRASLSKTGEASYEILAGVAWDEIDPPHAMFDLARQADAFVFGSLAQRSPVNRRTLRRFLDLLPGDALRIFDVNLRPPFDDLSTVRTLALDATVLKVNSDEAGRLSGIAPGEEENQARALADQTKSELIVITAGGRGAGMLRHGQWCWAEGRPVETADTVGAGDSFLASLTAGLLSGKLSDLEIVARASRIGEWVASQPGATPPYPPEMAKLTRLD